MMIILLKGKIKSGIAVHGSKTQNIYILCVVISKDYVFFSMQQGGGKKVKIVKKE